MSEKSKRMNKTNDWSRKRLIEQMKALIQEVNHHRAHWRKSLLYIQVVEFKLLKTWCSIWSVAAHAYICMLLLRVFYLLTSLRSWEQEKLADSKTKTKRTINTKKRRIFGKSPPKHSKSRILINQSERCTQAHWSQSVSLTPSAQVMWLISTCALLKNTSSV